MSQSLPQHVADVGRHRNDPPELSAVQRALLSLVLTDLGMGVESVRQFDKIQKQSWEL